MPIYAYKCQACGREHEALQKISDAPLTECPACHEQALKKQLTAPAFRLSGIGWYETDFKKDKRKNLAGDNPSGSSAGKSDSGGASDKAAGSSSSSGSSDSTPSSSGAS